MKLKLRNPVESIPTIHYHQEGLIKKARSFKSMIFYNFMIPVNQPDYRTDDDYRSKIANIGKI